MKTEPQKPTEKGGDTVDEQQKLINELDLDCIKFKLCDPKEGKGWSREMAEKAEHSYRRFLILKAKYPQKSIVPNKVVDEFWHQHILDTQKYAEDCERVFGFFLHHFPYFGMRGEEDVANLTRAFEESKRLLEAEFGDTSSAERAADCDSSACDDPPNCGSSCSGVRIVRNEERPRFSANA